MHFVRTCERTNFARKALCFKEAIRLLRSSWLVHIICWSHDVFALEKHPHRSQRFETFKHHDHSEGRIKNSGSWDCQSAQQVRRNLQAFNTLIKSRDFVVHAPRMFRWGIKDYKSHGYLGLFFNFPRDAHRKVAMIKFEF